MTEAQEVLAQAQPETMASLPDGYRYAVVASNYGGVAQRWVLIYSEHRQPQAQRTVDTQWRKQRDQEVRAFKTLCRTAFACEADAQQALTSFGAGLQTTFLHDSTVCPTPHYGKRGRPGPGAQPDQIVYPIAGALASRLTDRRARIDHQSCFILATNELDEGQLSAQAVLDGYKGQAQAERGLRFLKAPQFLASFSLSQKARADHGPVDGDDGLLARLCGLESTASALRSRTTRPPFLTKRQDASSTPLHGGCSTTSLGFMSCVSRDNPYIVLNLTEEHLPLLQLLGKRYVWFYR